MQQGFVRAATRRADRTLLLHDALPVSISVSGWPPVRLRTRAALKIVFDVEWMAACAEPAADALKHS
jgi:hypothetical protein